MPKKRKDRPEILDGQRHQEKEDSNDQAARFALAEEAALKDRMHGLHYEQMVELVAALSPSDVNRFLSAFSVDTITGFLGQIPNFPSLVARWTEQYFDSLNRPDIMADVERLQGLGVRRETMATAMMVIKFSPVFDNSFAQLGDTRERRRRAKRILAPLPDLHDFAKLFGDIPPLISRNIPNPTNIISELKLLSSIFDWGEFMYDCLGANHLLEVSKFGLASLVRETTGKFLDSAVAKLIGGALDHPRYDETGHRVWRIDNYERLQKNVPIVTRFLIALNNLA